MKQTSNMSEQDPNRALLDRCPDCGYLLTGLPASGRCPECGFTYSGDMIVLYGWGFGHTATFANRRWTTYRIGCLLLPVCALLSAVAWIVVDTMKIAWTWGSWQAMLILLPIFLPCLISAVQFGVGAIVGVLRRKQQWQDGLPPVQTRLSRHGFAQRDGLGPARIKHWKRRQVRFERLGDDTQGCRYWCRIEAPKLGGLALWRNPVDVELICDEKMAGLIRQRLSKWGVLDM